MVNNTSSLTATRYGHKNIVKYLLSNNADVNVKNRDGQTALHYGE
jgi:ankyrin repeat protein